MSQQDGTTDTGTDNQNRTEIDAYKQALSEARQRYDKNLQKLRVYAKQPPRNDIDFIHTRRRSYLNLIQACFAEIYCFDQLLDLTRVTRCSSGWKDADSSYILGLKYHDKTLARFVKPIRRLLQGETKDGLNPFELEWCNFFHVFTVFFKFMCRTDENEAGEYYRRMLKWLYKQASPLGNNSAAWALPYSSTGFRARNDDLCRMWLQISERIGQASRYRDGRPISTNDAFELQYCLHILPECPSQKTPEHQVIYNMITDPDVQARITALQKKWEESESQSENFKQKMKDDFDSIRLRAGAPGKPVALKQLMRMLRRCPQFLQETLEYEEALLKEGYREDIHFRALKYENLQHKAITFLLSLQHLYEKYLTATEEGIKLQVAQHYQTHDHIDPDFDVVLQQRACDLFLKPFYRIYTNQANISHPNYRNSFLYYFHFVFAHFLYFANCSSSTQLGVTTATTAATRKENWLKQLDACLNIRKKFYSEHLLDQKDDWAKSAKPDLLTGQHWDYQIARDEVARGNWEPWTVSDITQAITDIDKEDYASPPEGRHACYLWVTAQQYLYYRLPTETTPQSKKALEILNREDPEERTLRYGRMYNWGFFVDFQLPTVDPIRFSRDGTRWGRNGGDRTTLLFEKKYGKRTAQERDQYHDGVRYRDEDFKLTDKKASKLETNQPEIEDEEIPCEEEVTELIDPHAEEGSVYSYGARDDYDSDSNQTVLPPDHNQSSWYTI